MNPTDITRKTKILATLGPATDSAESMESIVTAGVSVVRLNFSHGNPDEHRQRVAVVRQVATKLNRDIGILGDLQGPKIRIERFASGPVQLTKGQNFILDSSLDSDAGTNQQVGIAYKKLPDDVCAGDVLLLNDGLMSMTVQKVQGTAIHCTVNTTGELSDKKGINLKGGGLSAPALTEKDRQDILLAAELDVDFLAVSFPSRGADMHLARRLFKEAGGNGLLLAKIERTEAITHLEEVIAASDVVMVARGDLAVEIGDPELPGVQKRIIAVSREMNKTVVTATQMMESMITNPAPTRAEVLDVANAVIDGTDAVMLSAETAVGRWPSQTVEAMAKVCIGAERHPITARSNQSIKNHFEQDDEAISMAAVYTAQHMQADAIIALTESGATALWMSRSAPNLPIFAMTRHHKTRHKMALVRGIYPIDFTPSSMEGSTPIMQAVNCLLEQGLVSSGQRVIVTKGDFTGPGGTNALKIVKVP